jgi:hypothetical protein
VLITTVEKRLKENQKKKKETEQKVERLQQMIEKSKADIARIEEIGLEILNRLEGSKARKAATQRREEAIRK